MLLKLLELLLRVLCSTTLRSSDRVVFSTLDGARVLTEGHACASDSSAYHEITVFVVDATNEARSIEGEARLRNLLERRSPVWKRTVGITTKNPPAHSWIVSV